MLKPRFRLEFMWLLTEAEEADKRFGGGVDNATVGE